MPEASKLRPLRVLYFTGDLGAGGSEAHLTGLICGLDRSRVRPELLLMRPAADRSRIEQVRRSGVTVHDLEHRPGRWSVIQGLKKSIAAIRRLRPDLVHSYGYPCDIYAALAGWRLRNVAVVTSRRGNQQRARRRLAYRLTNRFADGVVCVSDSALRFARDHDGLNVDRARAIPNGVDSDHFSMIETLPTPATVIGTHGRVRHIKGPDLLLEAFERISPRGLRLRIAGPVDDAWGDALRRRFAGRNDVEFLGNVQDVRGFLRSLQIYVLPSRSEGMSMSLLEAMASGLPIVATAVGSNPDLLTRPEAGILVEPDAESIARGLARLLDDPDSADRLRRAARRRAAEEFSHATMVRRFEDYYVEVRSARSESTGGSG